MKDFYDEGDVALGSLKLSSIKGAGGSSQEEKYDSNVAFRGIFTL